MTDPTTNTSHNYVRAQFDKLDASARFQIKVRGDKGETHWISVPPTTIRAVADVLAADGIDTVTVPPAQKRETSTGATSVTVDLEVLVSVLDAEVGPDARATILGEYQRRVDPESTCLTPHDTRLMYEDAMPMTMLWAACTTIVLDGDPADTDDADPVTAWRVQVRENDSDRVWEIDHEAWIAAMRRLVATPDKYALSDSIIEQIGRVLDAPDNESATDEVCQLDVHGFDAIVQVATLGQIVYG